MTYSLDFPSRRWRGKWWQFFGDCSGQDVTAMALAVKVGFNIACLSKGMNSTGSCLLYAGPMHRLGLEPE